VRTTILVLTVLVACPKRTVHLPASNTTELPQPGAPVIPTDPSIQAIGVPNGPMGSLVVACTDVVGPAGNACVVGDVEVPALIVGVAPLAEGAVSIPLSQGAIAWDRSDPGCENVVTTAEGGEPRWWEPGRPITAIAPDVAAAYVPEGLTVREALAVDLEGDGSDEWIVWAEAETGLVLGVLREQRVWIDLVEEVRGEAPEDATEQERWEAQASAASGDVVGITDLDLDGQLELVASAEWFEGWGYAVVRVDGASWTSLAQAGCAR
jgi:hypothetical protein